MFPRNYTSPSGRGWGSPETKGQPCPDQVTESAAARPGPSQTQTRRDQPASRHSPPAVPSRTRAGPSVPPLWAGEALRAPPHAAAPPRVAGPGPGDAERWGVRTTEGPQEEQDTSCGPHGRAGGGVATVRTGTAGRPGGRGRARNPGGLTEETLSGPRRAGRRAVCGQLPAGSDPPTQLPQRPPGPDPGRVLAGETDGLRGQLGKAGPAWTCGHGTDGSGGSGSTGVLRQRDVPAAPDPSPGHRPHRPHPPARPAEARDAVALAGRVGTPGQGHGSQRRPRAPQELLQGLERPAHSVWGEEQATEGHPLTSPGGRGLRGTTVTNATGGAADEAALHCRAPGPPVAQRLGSAVVSKADAGASGPSRQVPSLPASPRTGRPAPGAPSGHGAPGQRLPLRPLSAQTGRAWVS